MLIALPGYQFPYNNTVMKRCVSTLCRIIYWTGDYWWLPTCNSAQNAELLLSPSFNLLWVFLAPLHCWPPSLVSRTLGHPPSNPFLPSSCCWSQAGRRCYWRLLQISYLVLTWSDLSTLITVVFDENQWRFLGLVGDRGRPGVDVHVFGWYIQAAASKLPQNPALITFTQFFVDGGFWVIMDFKLVLCGLCRFFRCTRDGFHAFVSLFPTLSLPIFGCASVLDFWDSLALSIRNVAILPHIGSSSHCLGYILFRGICWILAISKCELE